MRFDSVQELNFRVNFEANNIWFNMPKVISLKIDSVQKVKFRVNYEANNFRYVEPNVLYLRKTKSNCLGFKMCLIIRL